ncbi:unnamed protein product [Alopecurus aequalis]
MAGRRAMRPVGMRGLAAAARASPAVSFLLAVAAAAALVGGAYFWVVVASFRLPEPGARGCLPDGEGSWAIGMFYGKSPFLLRPIELEGRSSANSSAWPVANPVLTCASATEAGYPSNFVADPFLYLQGDTLFLFFETKTTTTMQGDIAVARSFDQGATWEFLGIALDEAWHLSYPFVFKYENEIYMMPEGNKKKELRLYRATKFPLEWTLEKVLINRPLVDAALIQFEGNWWIFASDFTRHGTEKNAELEIWYSSSPLGPWNEHKQNPIYKSDKSLGARNGGRLFIFEGTLYRPGQDCSGTYGRKVKLYRVEKLSKEEYKEVPANLGIEEPKKGRNAWNGMRYHHLDVQQLDSGGWIAVMDGDRVPSGDSTRRALSGYVGFLLAIVLVIFVGFVKGAVNCYIPPSFWPSPTRRNELSRILPVHHLNQKVRRYSTSCSRYVSSTKAKLNEKTWSNTLFFCVIALVGTVNVCIAVHFLFSGNGAEQAYTHQGQHSQFTMVTMTYEARLWNLKLFVEHYSRCESVREIVVVWNKGNPPTSDAFDSTVPVRIRVEETNSLNNRFRVDPLIKTRAVFELDDDIMMTCSDVEKGFKVWREHPERMVGFYPRMIDGDPPRYRNERYARGKKGYNLILTGAAFMDSAFAFSRYWSEEAREGREYVHKNFNCEDLLMNFMYANASASTRTGARTVEYVHPAWAIDTSKFSSVAISRDTQKHYDVRTSCLAKFASLYGPLPQRWEFGKRQDGWDK